MLTAVLVLLIILWFLGYVHIPGILIPDITLFSINNYPVTLWDLLIFVLIIWAVEILPTPFREIAGLVLLLWILSLIGILAITGLSSILVLVIIVGLVVALFSGI